MPAFHEVKSRHNEPRLRHEVIRAEIIGYDRRSSASWLFRFEAFTALQTIGLNELLISREGLLRFRQAADAAVGLTQLKIGGVTIWRKFFCSFETFDGAGGIALLQKRAAKFEARHFIIWLGLNHFPQEGRRLLRVTL